MPSFQGPYTMPKGAGGRVPPTSGELSPPGSAAPRGGFPRSPYSTSFSRWSRALSRFQSELNRYGGAYAALANLDPASARRGSRRADAFLTQFLPDWYYQDAWNWSWSKQVPKSAGTWVVPSNYTFVTCGFAINPITGFAGGRLCGALKIGAPFYPADDPLFPGTQNWISQWGKSAATTGRCEARFFPPSGVADKSLFRQVPGTITLPQPEADPWDAPWPATQMQTMYGPKTGVATGLKPYQSSSTDTVVSPGGARQGPPGGGVHNHVPPPPGTREKKGKANYGFAGKAYGAVTEVQDFSDCLVNAERAGAKAVGKKLGPAPGRWNPVGRAEWLLKHANHFDMEAFISCVATQQVSDSLMGAASKNIDRRFREKGYLNGLRGINGGRPSGLATGPHNQAISQALSRRMR